MISGETIIGNLLVKCEDLAFLCVFNQLIVQLNAFLQAVNSNKHTHHKKYNHLLYFYLKKEKQSHQDNRDVIKVCFQSDGHSCWLIEVFLVIDGQLLVPLVNSKNIFHFSVLVYAYPHIEEKRF